MTNTYVRSLLMLASLMLANLMLPTAVYAEEFSALTESNDNASIADEASLSLQIDINLASADELTKLKGIGHSKAQAIIDYRTTKGAFSSIDELVAVKGIGSKWLEQHRAELFLTAIN
jgi:competence protein ComEA